MNENTINNDMTMGGAAATLLAGRYRVVRQLGQGGMGSVWLAEDTKLDGFRVAIKMLPSVLVNNKRAYAQVKAEALVSLKLSHPNIATVRAFEEENGNPFLVMDYIDGQTLDDYLAEKGKLSEDETIRLLKPVAAALDYAHAQGVVHRDVKPGNIMIRRDGTPFVLDFGIAREIQETMTRVTGKLSSGTLLYMSPEQLNGDAPKPPQDIYSFAAMTYECLKGEPPFNRGGVEDQIKHKAPETLPGHIAICRGVMAGLAKRPEARPATCAAVLEKGGKKAAKTSTGASASKLRIAVIGLPLALAALVGLGGWFGWSAYCRAEENRLAMIKAEMERKSAWRRLELEADRLASQVDEARRVSECERFAKREGLGTKAKELEDAAKSGQLALSATNLVVATNWFHVALSCSDWLSSNAVLHAQCMQAAQAALKARNAADGADAKNLASNEYGKAKKELGQADEALCLARFTHSESLFERSRSHFVEALELAKRESAWLREEARQKAEEEKAKEEAAAQKRQEEELAAAKAEVEKVKTEARRKQEELEKLKNVAKRLELDKQQKPIAVTSVKKNVRDRLVGKWRCNYSSDTLMYKDDRLDCSYKLDVSESYEFREDGTFVCLQTSKSSGAYRETPLDYQQSMEMTGRWQVEDGLLVLKDQTYKLASGSGKLPLSREKLSWKDDNTIEVRSVGPPNIAGNPKNLKWGYDREGRYSCSYEVDVEGGFIGLGTSVLKYNYACSPEIWKRVQ